MKVRRLKKDESPLEGEFTFTASELTIKDGSLLRIAFDKDLPLEEQELLCGLITWSHVDNGTISDKTWHDYVNDENPPEDASGWSLDWWEQVFEEYD